jgi:transposase
MPHIQAPARDRLQLPNLEEFIEKDNVVRVIDAFVDSLDLQAIGFEKVIAKVEGRPCYPPAAMLKLYLYGYLNGVRSSRKLERESRRNMELYWLLQGLSPVYHTIADFRKDHCLPLRMVFHTFLAFLQGQDLLGGEMVGIDGSKFRAVNSKKNNYNERKIKRHLGFIEQKTEQYLQQLQQGDFPQQALPEATAALPSSYQADQVLLQPTATQAQPISKAAIQSKLVCLQQRKEKYLKLREQVKASIDQQVSTTDADSRALILHRNIVEIAYNLQMAVDSKHKLIVHCKAINRNDAKALFFMALAAKTSLGVPTLTVLADKGYHNGQQLRSCQRESITTLVAYRAHVERQTGTTPAYYSNKFSYSKQSDSYTCPQGHLLTSNGRWYARYTKKNPYKIKRYTTPACQSCPVKELCSKRKYGRNMDRSEYQDAVDENNHNIDVGKETYNQRQALCEHPFGTIKRAWGYSYTLLKGLKKVNGEMALICTVYNLRRSLTILGVNRLVTLFKAQKLQTIASVLSYVSRYRSFLKELILPRQFFCLVILFQR